MTNLGGGLRPLRYEKRVLSCHLQAMGIVIDAIESQKNMSKRGVYLCVCLATEQVYMSISVCVFTEQVYMFISVCLVIEQVYMFISVCVIIEEVYMFISVLVLIYKGYISL